MNKVIAVKTKLFRHLGDLRSLGLLINDPYFADALKHKEKEVESLIYEATTNPNFLDRSAAYEKLKILIKKFDPAGQRVEDLRALASQLGIPRYSRMDKEGLLDAINSVRSNRSCSSLFRIERPEQTSDSIQSEKSGEPNHGSD